MPERSSKDLQISRFTKQTTGNYFRLFKRARTPDSDLNQLMNELTINEFGFRII